ncbi:helix-turn-helix domain-containing protein [Candidatus Margulisiibacteriota bacterium]
MSVADNVKKYRKMRKYSQQKLASTCNIAISTLQKIEQGKHTNPSLSVMLELSKALNVPIDKLAK